MSRAAMWKWLTRLAVSGLAVGALFTPAAQASNGDDEAAVAGVLDTLSPGLGNDRDLVATVVAQLGAITGERPAG